MLLSHSCPSADSLGHSQSQQDDAKSSKSTNPHTQEVWEEQVPFPAAGRRENPNPSEAQGSVPGQREHPGTNPGAGDKEIPAAGMDGIPSRNAKTCGEAEVGMRGRICLGPGVHPHPPRVQRSQIHQPGQAVPSLLLGQLLATLRTCPWLLAQGIPAGIHAGKNEQDLLLTSPCSALRADNSQTEFHRGHHIPARSSSQTKPAARTRDTAIFFVFLGGV